MLFRRCPQCASENVHRSRRRGFYERLLLRLRRHRPYRCYQCGHRFYASDELVRAPEKADSAG